MKPGPSRPELLPALRPRRPQDAAPFRKLARSRKAAAAIAALRGLGAGVQTTLNNAATAGAQKTGDTFNVL